jgi:assimilatory nitrate reductase catalytic subunit
MASAVREVRSTCCYCGVGCGVLIATDGSHIVGVRGDPDHPANFGRLCSKGATLALTARPELADTRVLHPELRHDRSQPRVRATWDEALDHAANRFADIIARHGPDAVAFYVSGQLLTEDYHVFNKLARAVAGTHNIDTNSRLCMSSASAGYKATLGADAPPCAYEDLDHATLVLIAGANPAVAHPVLYRRLEAARARRPDLRVVVADPRRTETAREADLHLPLLPGTDVALLNGMLHVLLWDGLVDRDFIDAHTEGFAAVKDAVRAYTPAAAAELCGIAERDLIQAGHWLGEAQAALSLYCQGLNQSTAGTAKNIALVNLHLATGQIGRPGAGPFSLTGQPNAMGGREVGGLANLLPGHREAANPEHRTQIARLWGVEALPTAPGKTAVEMFEALRAGSIRAIWIACTNPAQSLPDQRLVHEALATAEFVVVQEAYAGTETARYADVLLPAATWGEKQGTVTNSERRISRVHAAVAPPGEARADWEIAADFGRRLAARVRPDRAGLLEYRSVEDAWLEHREATRGRDLDITGLTYRLLDEAGPQQWPLPGGAAAGRTRLYEDGVFPTASGRARFVAVQYEPPADRPDARFSLRLTTGRLRDQWHGMSRTGTVAQLFGHTPEPALSLHPDDLVRRGLRGGDLVRVESRRGGLVLPVQSDAELASGQAFLPMHWGRRFLASAGSHGVNTLTTRARDPESHQPELKHAAVRVTKAELPWCLVAFGLPATGSASRLADRLAALGAAFEFAVAVLIGREREGALLRAAAAAMPDPATIAAIDAALGLDHPAAIRYDDSRRGVGRRLSVSEGQLAAVRLCGDTDAVAAAAWLQEWLVGGRPVDPIRRLLLAPAATPPGGCVIPDRVVCTCENVAARAIADALPSLPASAVESLALLQARLKCGTGCGSCLPELKRMIAGRERALETAA